MLEAATLSIAGGGIVSVAPPRRMVLVAAFRGRQQDVAAALGVALPGTPCRVIIGATAYAWAGPETWLITGDAPVGNLQGLAAITEQSDGRSILRVAGPHARKVLAKLVPIDLAEPAFGPHATALTLAGHIPVQIWREETWFALCCFRSFAKSLYHSLDQAAKEFES